MNKRNSALTRLRTLSKYNIPGSMLKRPKNAIYISTANDLRHELGKFMICWMLANGTNIDYYWKDVRKSILQFCKLDLSEFTFPNESKQYITEAVDRNHKRRDIVVLDDDQAIEVVYKHKSRKLFSEYKKANVDYYEI